MADPPRNPDPEGDNTMRSHRGSATGTPRWVKVFGTITIVVVVLFVILLLSGRGHGPGRHLSGGLPDQIPSFGVVAAGSADGAAPSAGDRE